MQQEIARDRAVESGIVLQLGRELAPGERLLWSGRPAQGLRLRASDVIVIPFSLMWGGFACFWEATVLVNDAPLIFKLWGIPFVLVGLYITIGRFFYESWVRSRTMYGLTDRRALLLVTGRTRSLASVALATLEEVTLSEHYGNTGSIALGRVIDTGKSSRKPPTFEFIAEPHKVHSILRDAQHQARR